MKIFLTGGTGFVGSEVLRQLVAEGYEVRCLVRSGSEEKLATRDNVEIHHGDATEPESLAGALAGCSAVIHLVGIIREFPARGITFQRLHAEATANMVRAAEDQGIKRFLQMSANGTRGNAANEYHRTKWAAEEAVRHSCLDWTIFRPSLIYGPDDEFVSMLVGLIRKLPVVPVIGDGRYRMSPVAVQDVATGFLRALQREASSGQTYHCCGPQSHSYNEVLDLIGRALGRSKVAKLHHPVALMKPAVALLDSIPQFPVTSTQLAMLLEGNVCDPGPWAEAFDLAPIPFYEGLCEFLSPR